MKIRGPLCPCHACFRNRDFVARTREAALHCLVKSARVAEEDDILAERWLDAAKMHARDLNSFVPQPCLAQRPLESHQAAKETA